MAPVTPSSSQAWKQTVLPNTHINPKRLKEYLDKNFEKEYRVKQVGDQYYIRTLKDLTDTHIYEIRHPQTTLEAPPTATSEDPSNPTKTAPDRPQDATSVGSSKPRGPESLPEEHEEKPLGQVTGTAKTNTTQGGTGSPKSSPKLSRVPTTRSIREFLGFSGPKSRPKN